jgi:hypothetical protein
MKGFQMFVATMLFYVALSYVLMPAAFYYFGNRTLMAAGNGFIVGSVISVVMWLSFRSQIV